jgi:adenine phosphoribosyltransferase
MNTFKILKLFFIGLLIAVSVTTFSEEERERTDDISALLENPALLQQAVAISMQRIQTTIPKVEALVAVEGRDFILASILSYKLNLPLVLYRRLSKLPVHPDPTQSPQAVSVDIVLYHGGKVKAEKMAIHSDALRPGQKVAIVGSYLYGDYPTADAKELVQKMGAEVVQTLCFPNPAETLLLPELTHTLAPLVSTVKAMKEERKAEIIQELSDPSIIRTVPNWPKPGIAFKDLTSLLLQPEKFKSAIDLIIEEFRQQKIDGIWALESRGFLFAPVAFELGIPLYPIHKKGKVLEGVQVQSIALEYGSDEIEVSLRAKRDGGHQKHQKHEEHEAPRAAIVDDLIATGGTLDGACSLAQKMGWKVTTIACLMEIPELKGREKLQAKTGINTVTFLQFPESGKKLHVAVTSQKEIKIAPIKKALQAKFPDREILIEGFATASGVSAQPVGQAMGEKGATQRIGDWIKQVELQDKKFSGVAWDYVFSIENFITPGEKNWTDQVSVAAWDVKNQRMLVSSSSHGALVNQVLAKKFQLNEELEGNQPESVRTVGKVIKAFYLSHEQKIADDNWHAHADFGGHDRQEWILEQVNHTVKNL